METDITKGLNQQQVAESRNRHGDNVLTPPEKASVWTQFLEKFKDPLIKILLVALVLSIGIACYEAFWLNAGGKAFLEPLGIFLAVTLATVIGFVIELNANKKFEMLNQMNDDAAVTVVRDGNITQVARRDIVVGDVVILETGDEVPADGNLVDSVSLSINESTLTGEPVIKKTHIEADFKKDATYPSNRALRGTTVTEGHGTMLVDAVGDATEYGKVYEAAQIDNGVKTPLTLQFERLGRLVSYASYTIGALIIVGRLCIYNYGAGFEWMGFIEYLLTTIMLAVTLIVVSVPEGLPMSVTLSLALSMRRMLATNNLVRKMHACETMGATTVICTDKTGTLTQNQMRIYETQFAALGKSQQLADNDESRLIAEAIAVNSTAFLDRGADRPTVVGNPTEGALLLWLNDQHTDYKPLRDNAAVTEQLPFSTMRKFMATVVDSGVCPGKRIAYVKGAPEIVIDKCHNFPDGVTKEQLREALLGYQQKAMRTLGFAYQEVGDGKAVESDSLNADNLTFMGIVAISDPVRADVPAAVKESIDAGIKIKIVTGDTPGTAKEIGRQIGLWNDNTDNDSNIITGPRCPRRQRRCRGGTPHKDYVARTSYRQVKTRRTAATARRSGGCHRRRNKRRPCPQRRAGGTVDGRRNIGGEGSKRHYNHGQLVCKHHKSRDVGTVALPKHPAVHPLPAHRKPRGLHHRADWCIHRTAIAAHRHTDAVGKPDNGRFRSPRARFAAAKRSRDAQQAATAQRLHHQPHDEMVYHRSQRCVCRRAVRIHAVSEGKPSGLARRLQPARLLRKLPQLQQR